MDELRQDVAFALRSIVLRPAFSLLLMGTLALGIGANTAVFSVVKGLLFEPLPYAEADRLVLIDQRTPEGFTASVSLPNYRDWKERAQSFDRFSAILPSSAPLSRSDGARIIEIGWVHGGFFETLGVEPMLGRVFTEGEAEPGAERVVVLSHALWVTEFGSDPAVVGRLIALRDEPWMVIGVMPPDFAPYGEILAYLPMGYVADRVAWNDRESAGGTEVFARLRPGTTPRTAQAELESVGEDIARAYGEDTGHGNLTPLRDWYLGDADRQVLLLMAAVALVLLVACGNVATLLFVRGEQRRAEVAVRAALGASRSRVARQLLTENVLLGLGGGLVGIAFGVVGLDVLLAVFGHTLPAGFVGRIDVDLGVLAFAAALSLATTVLAGLLPAARSSEARLSDVLREAGSRTRSPGVARDVLIALEMAFSMVLLVGAGLIISSLVALQGTDPGFDSDSVLTLRVQTPRGSYGDRSAWTEFHRRIREEAEAVAGVRSVATSNHFPLSGNSWEMLYRDEATPPDDRGESVLLTMVSPSFFETFGVEILEGRGFTRADRMGGELVAIVDESLARARWPGEAPLGKRITFETSPTADGERRQVWRTVVGVAEHVRHYELTSPSRIQVYTPIDQSVAWGFTSYVSLRAGRDPASLVPSLRQVIARIDPDAGIYRVRTLRGLVDEHLGPHRAMRALLTVFALAALLLGCIGIYSVVSHAAVQRTREIGVRMALGGAPSAMIGLVMRGALRPVATGLVAGAVAAAAFGQSLGALLYDVRPADPGVIAAASAILLGVAALSAWVPARALAKVAPREALGVD